MDFRYRFVRPEIWSAEMNAIFDEKLTEQDKIENDIAIQITTIGDAMKEIKESQQITPEQLQKEMQVIKNCGEGLKEDPLVDDMKLSTLIGCANALGGIIKISIKFDDGSQAELL